MIEIGLVAYSSFKNSITSKVTSPDQNISVEVWLEDGQPYYSVNYKDEKVVASSTLRLVLSNNDTLTAILKLANVLGSKLNETWE